MGRAPCCEKEGLKKGPWTPEEDKILADYIQSNGHGNWRSLPKLAGLLRCGKSCRLRWTNYLRPDIKRGPFTSDEQKCIIQLHGIVGNKYLHAIVVVVVIVIILLFLLLLIIIIFFFFRVGCVELNLINQHRWSTIAAQLPGRTDNEVKNYWNTHLKKRLIKMGIDPDTYSPAIAVVADASPCSPGSSSSQASAAATRHMAQWENARLEAEARLAKESLLYSITTITPSSAASVSNAVVSEQEGPNVPEKAEIDFFLRIWNSEVGQNFRNNKRAVEDSSSSSPAASSTKCKDVKEGEVVECKNGAGDGTSLEEVVDETSSENYELYLDFADDVGMGNLFNGQFGGLSLFSGDMNLVNMANDSCLDDASEAEKARVRH